MTLNPSKSDTIQFSLSRGRSSIDEITAVNVSGAVILPSATIKSLWRHVGPSSVVQTALEVKAGIGGEGSGSVVHTPFSYGYDAFLFMQKVIDFLRKESSTLSRLSDEFSDPQTHKTTIPLPANEVYDSLERIERLYSHTTRLKDGFYIEEGEDWLCIRASSTMAMIRVVGEGKSVSSEIDRIKESLR